MSGADPSPTRRYKEVMAEVGAAADALREWDRRRAVELRAALLGLEDEMLREGERARLSTSVARLHWEEALELLWAESWLRLRPCPAPDPRADPSRLDDYDAEVHRLAGELRAVVRRRWYEFGR